MAPRPPAFQPLLRRARGDAFHRLPGANDSWIIRYSSGFQCGALKRDQHRSRDDQQTSQSKVDPMWSVIRADPTGQGPGGMGRLMSKVVVFLLLFTSGVLESITVDHPHRQSSHYLTYMHSAYPNFM